jgi:hypothetical protein
MCEGGEEHVDNMISGLIAGRSVVQVRVPGEVIEPGTRVILL